MAIEGVSHQRVVLMPVSGLEVRLVSMFALKSTLRRFRESWCSPAVDDGSPDGLAGWKPL